jgi:ribosomal protein S18 acetylase RimI-like enzyme
LRRRSRAEVTDLLAWRERRLIGFCGLYTFGGPVEIAGAVAPDERGRGTGSLLLDAALAQARGRAVSTVLLIVPRVSRGGRRFAHAHGGTLHHSEHHLVLRRRPTGGQRRSDVRVRDLASADEPAAAAILTEAFGPGGSGPAREPERFLAIDVDGATAGLLRLDRDGPRAAIYGFAVAARWRGQGIGRQALVAACERAWDAGAREITLEVEVDNEHALGLYTSEGFEPAATEDYYKIPLAGGFAS